MNNIEFLNFTPIENESHLGTAAIRIDRKYIFRYKISKNPNGDGYWIGTGSVKVDQSDKPYKQAFEFDSGYERDQIKEFVLSNVKRCLQEYCTPKTITFGGPVPIEQTQFDFTEQPPF